MEEPPPARFFPPVGQGGTSFSGYVSPAAAERFALEDEARDVQKDQRATEMESNAYRRLESRSRSRLLPYTEAADIAAAKTRRAREESEERLNPFAETAGRERAQAEAEQYAAERRALPGKEALETAGREAAMDAIQSGEDGLKRSGIDPSLYDLHLRRLPGTLPKSERQRQARNAALRVQNEQPMVNAIEEELMDVEDPAEREKFLLDDMDDETGIRFTRINPKAPPAEVNRLLARARTRRARDARDKEQRAETQAHESLKLRVLSERKSELARRVADFPNDAEAAADLKEINAELDLMWKKPKGAKPESAPAKGEKATEGENPPAPTLSRWLGK